MRAEMIIAGVRPARAAAWAARERAQNAIERIQVAARIWRRDAYFKGVIYKVYKPVEIEQQRQRHHAVVARAREVLSR